MYLIKLFIRGMGGSDTPMCLIKIYNGNGMWKYISRLEIREIVYLRFLGLNHIRIIT